MNSLRQLFYALVASALIANSGLAALAQSGNDNDKARTLAALSTRVAEQQKAVDAASNADARLALAKQLANLEIELGGAHAALGQHAEAGEWYARADRIRQENYQVERLQIEEQIAKIEALIRDKRADTKLSEKDRSLFIGTFQSVIDAQLDILDSLASERNDLSTRAEIAERRLSLARARKDPETIATALEAVAEAHRKAGDLVQARAAAEEGLQFRLVDPRRKYIHGTIFLLASIADDANDWREAEARYREVIELTKPGKSLAPFDLNAESNPETRRARARMNVQDRLDLERSALDARLNIADILQRKGNYREADQEQRAVVQDISRLYAIGAEDETELLRWIGEREDKSGEAINKLASQIKSTDVVAHRESAATAISVDEKERLHYAELFAKAIRAEVAVRHAGLLAAEGELNAAAKAYEEAIALYTNVLGGAFPVSGLYSALGSVERERGNYAAAEASLATALTVYQRNQDGFGIAAVLAQQSSLRLDQNRIAEARQLAEDALKIARTLGYRPQVAGLLRALGRAESEAGGDALKASEQHLRESLVVWRDLGLRPHVAYTLSSLGLTLEKQGRDDEALATYEEAVRLIELLTTSLSKDVSPDVFNSSRGNRELYDRLIKLLIKRGRTADALRYLERAKSKALVDALAGANVNARNPALDALLNRVRNLGESVRVAETTLAGELAAPPEKREAAKLNDTRAKLADAQKNYLEAIEQVKRANPFYASLVAVNPTNLVEVRGRLPEKTVLLEYFPTEKELYIFVMRSDRAPTVRSSPIGRADLAKLIAQYRQVIESMGDPLGGVTTIIERSTRGGFWKDDGTEEFKKYVAPIKETTLKLYGALIAPVQTDIDRADSLLIVPAGELYYLPIHALGRAKPDGDLEFLIEKKRFAYFSSADLLNVVTSFKSSSNFGKTAQPSLLALGNPRGDLDSATEEMEALRKLFPAASIYTRTEATLAHVKQAAASFQYIHFATHGAINNSDPKESYLVLAGEPERLTVRNMVEDTYGLSFAGTKLAVLSACNTNIGGFDPGATYSSLSRAFAKAGAPAVVASLWEVDDESTRDTMTNFYKELAAGQPKAEALRRAQLAVMRDPKFAHPYFWSAFMVLGDWR